MNIKSSKIQTQRASTKLYLSILTLLSAIYYLWLLTFWPGVLGQDSLAILLEVNTNGSFQSGKPNFWYFFVKIFYEPMKLVEMPIIAQMGFTVLIFSRILTWCWRKNLRKTFFFSLLFICLAPHMIYFSGTLYADGIYSVATVGLLFELWLIADTKKIDRYSLAMVAMTLPFALFARPNGIISLIPVAIAVYILDSSARMKLIGITLAWCCLVLIASEFHKTRKHDTFFALALFETANFLQPRPMNLWEAEPRVSGKTIQILTKNHSLQNIIENYDRDYWDSLVFKPDGPNLLTMNPEEKSVLVNEFFRYNLWKNIPAFVGSRVNVFLVALLAKGGFPGLDYSPVIISESKSKSEFRVFHLTGVEVFLKSIHEFSYAYRWLIWTPLLGIFLLLRVTRLAWKQRDLAGLAVTTPMVIQLGGIFIFSIAGEYRYLLPFFTLPMLLLPILASTKKIQCLQHYKHTHKPPDSRCVPCCNERAGQWRTRDT